MKSSSRSSALARLPTKLPNCSSSASSHRAADRERRTARRACRRCNHRRSTSATASLDRAETIARARFAARTGDASFLSMRTRPASPRAQRRCAIPSAWSDSAFSVRLESQSAVEIVDSRKRFRRRTRARARVFRDDRQRRRLGRGRSGTLSRTRRRFDRQRGDYRRARRRRRRRRHRRGDAAWRQLSDRADRVGTRNRRRAHAAPSCNAWPTTEGEAFAPHRSLWMLDVEERRTEPAAGVAESPRMSAATCGSSTRSARRSAATAARSPPFGPTTLPQSRLRAIVERTGIDARAIDDVYFGAANQSGEDNRNVARMAVLLADFRSRCRA